MVAEVCLGKVGAVAAREVSRFARNSREWQQLVEVCRAVDTVLVDQETVYAPRQSNDRLLLGRGLARWAVALDGADAEAQLGRTAEAKEALEKAISRAPAIFDMYVRKRVPWFRPEDHAHLIEGLRKAGMPEA
jgi:hypothetical protein